MNERAMPLVPQDGALLPATCDVLVVGSGAGGLATAVVAARAGLEVLVIEKAPVLGGTSAWSGGWLWIPRNPLAERAGIIEDETEPRRYLASELGNAAGDPRIDVFLANGPEMVRWFEAETEVAFVDGNRVPDFHATPGHATGGRSVAGAPYDGRRLGPWLDKLRPPLDLISVGGMGIASGADLGHFVNWLRSTASFAHVTRRFLRHGRDLVRHGRSAQLVNGNALVARLLRSALDAGVAIRTGAPAVALIVEDGRVVGARVAGAAPGTVRARRGVVLATGGFPHDAARIAAMFEHAPDGTGHHSAAPEGNTGDGMRIAEAVGAVVADDLVHPGAWAPVSLVPRKDGSVGRFPHLVERSKPGFLAVDSHGRRFVNEADSYHDFMAALFRATPAGEAPVAWLLADHRAQRRWGLGGAKPFPFPLRPYLASGYLKRGRTIGELALACGLDPAALEATVTAFNRAAAAGDDPAFGRGRSAYNKVQGDAAATGRNPSLGPVEAGPFYAVRIVPGSLGTFAGLRTDAAARVLGAGSAAIPGLFAVGNDMSSIMGGTYPSGGITLGPAMTFGYVAGRVLAGLPVTGLPVGGLEETREEIGETAG
ncbi:MAG: FAD-dependent oxidoreductase [Amaricoccus sp.]|uniref:FAD-dependent oxidoreductase n=1 Tax=Amaricoccus sp. TaxID=1872485 RepID=UPI0039E6A9BF